MSSDTETATVGYIVKKGNEIVKAPLQRDWGGRRKDGKGKGKKCSRG